MNINAAIINRKVNFVIPSNAASLKKTQTFKNNINRCEVPISAACYKANYMPSFGKFEKKGETTVIDKTTGEPKKAVIKEERIGCSVSYKLEVDKKEAGYLDMIDYTRPEDLPEQIKNMGYKTCEVRHLRSLAGEKYAGIGSALIKTAIAESYNAGCSGNIWLDAEKGYAHSLSSYRSNENPIPFYYKVGFESVDSDENKFIKDCLKKADLKSLPDSASLMLTGEAKEKWINELIQNFTIKLKN